MFSFNLFSERKRLYPISKVEMNALIAEKKDSRFEKGKPFNCFELDYPQFEFFLTALNAHLNSLPDQTRFQIVLGMHVDPFWRAAGIARHWLVLDFYKKNATLHSLTFDATGVYSTIQPILELLAEIFSNGHHYYFDGQFGPIQYSRVHCQTFAREQSGQLSNIDADELYDSLKKHGQSNRSFRQTSYFSFFHLSKLAFLLPLFRNMQSEEYVGFVPQNLKGSPISNKGTTYQEWINQHSKIENKKWRNGGSDDKDQKYTEELKGVAQQINPPFAPRYNKGFGFIAVTAKLGPLLENYSAQQFNQLIMDLCATLEETPKIRANPIGRYFEVKACHAEKTKVVQKELKDLLALNRFSKKIKQQFLYLIEDYMDYLYLNSSVRTRQQVENFFNDQIENRLKKVI